MICLLLLQYSIFAPIHLDALTRQDADSFPHPPPPLFVRLAPDYLQNGQINWYFSPKADSELALPPPPPTLPSLGTLPYSADERREFMDLCHEELTRILCKEQRRTPCYRRSLSSVAKSWVGCLCYLHCASPAHFLLVVPEHICQHSLSACVVLEQI